MAHIDRCLNHLALIVDSEADRLRSCERISDKRAVARLHVSTVDEKLREAAHAIAAHLGKRSV